MSRGKLTKTIYDRRNFFVFVILSLDQPPCILKYLNSYVQPYIHTYKYAHKQINKQTYKHTYIHIYRHTHTHTHTFSDGTVTEGVDVIGGVLVGASHAGVVRTLCVGGGGSVWPWLWLSDMDAAIAASSCSRSISSRSLPRLRGLRLVKGENRQNGGK